MDEYVAGPSGGWPAPSGQQPTDPAALNDPPRRSVARNAAALMGSQSLTWVLATIMLSIQPRFLGPEAAGQLRLGASLWAMVTVLATFGTSTFVTVEVAKNRQIATSLTNAANRLRIITFIAFCPVVAVFMWVAGYDRTTVLVALVFGLGAGIAVVATTYGSTLLGLQEMGQTAKVDVLTKFLVTVASAIILILGGRAFALLWLWAVFSVFGLLMIIRAFRRVAPPRQVATQFVGKALIKASFPFLLAEATLVIYQQIDTVVMSLLVDKEAIGWYATADVLFGSLLFVPVILMTSLFPAIADLYSRDPDEVNRMLQRTFRSLLLVAVPIGLATIVVAKPFVDLLYGEKFAETAQVLQIYGAVVVLSCMTILLGRFALATGKVKFWTVLMVLSIFASIPLDLVLVPFTDHRYHNGAMGGALAYVFTESFMLVVGVIKLSPGLFDSETAKRILRCAIAGAMMLAASWPLRTHFFLVPGIVSLVVYGVAMLLMRTLNEDERRMVNRFTEAARRLSGRRKRAA